MTICRDCGKDMWEYCAAAKKDGWCIEYGPECYERGIYVGKYTDDD
jgi:hypothetical protein